jgi:hypothetical protein
MFGSGSHFGSDKHQLEHLESLKCSQQSGGGEGIQRRAFDARYLMKEELSRLRLGHDVKIKR